MLLTEKNNSFEAHPAGHYRAVLVDATPLKVVESKFGKKEVFRLVFETENVREDGRRSCMWSKNLTPSLHEKSSLRKTLKQIIGRDLTADERKGFELENLIGVPVNLMVGHEESNGTVYANILAITPDAGANPLKPSGDYIRVQDRVDKGGGAPVKTSFALQAPAGPEVQQPEWKSVVVHVGINKGKPLGDLTEAQLQALHDKWLPGIGENPSPEDQALKTALLNALDQILY